MDALRTALPAPAQGMDWIDRAVCAYLILPILLFCLWFVTPVAAVLVALTGYGAYRGLRGDTSQAAVLSGGWLVAIFGLSLVWTAIAGVGHFFYSNSDWIVRDAVLHDLSLDQWPPTYLWLGNLSFVLRAPVAYFLPAAAIGQWSRPEIANFALYLWTALGWGLMLAAGCRMFDTRRQRVLCLIVLVWFGGMDLLGHLWSLRALPAPGEHIEWWMQGVQYSSNTTLLFWVPNHALPSWLGILLLLRHWRQPVLARITPLMAAAIPLWSPLAAIGLFPFFLFGLAWRRDFKTLLSPASCLVFVPVALLIASYLGVDAAQVRHGWLSQFFASTSAYVYCMVLFCLLEFGFLALILARLIRFDLPMRIAIAVLCLLPLYFYGPGNDLAMRASIPALTVLAIATVRPLADTQRSLWHALLAGTLAIGALGAAQEPLRSLLNPRWTPRMQTIPQSVMNEHPDTATLFPAHYFAHVNDSGIFKLLRSTRPVDVRMLADPQTPPK